MVYASLIFLYIFLPANLILYYLFKNSAYRNILLTIFSFIFYAWGEPVWIILLMFSATIDYFNGMLIEKNRGTVWEKVGLISSITVNMGLLLVFKYSGFIYDNINQILGLNLKVHSFALPIGISFYTFQTVSYVIDVYRKKVTAQPSLLKFMMFVSLYHQLVAGPIVRYAHIAHEIDNRKVNVKDISSGVIRFCIGLFKKVCIANIAGEFVLKYMGGDISGLSILESWYGLLMFSIQIYFDFSGYSDMAIGLGKMFGFHYHENFIYPYISKSATEFWRRWHISLGSFFRDYLYIPLGGNRKRQAFNLLVVWFLTGLWHGASWNFILWGLYFGVLIWMERLFLSRILKKLPAFFSHFYLLFAVIISWALFYFTDLNQLLQYLKIMFGRTTNPFSSFDFGFVFRENILWLLMALILCLPVYITVNDWFKKQVENNKRYYMWAFSITLTLISLFLATSMLVGKSYNPFIYFRF